MDLAFFVAKGRDNALWKLDHESIGRIYGLMLVLCEKGGNEDG